MHEVAGTGNGDEGEVLLQPLPGIVEAGGEKGIVVEAVNHEDRTGHLDHRAFRSMVFR